MTGLIIVAIVVLILALIVAIYGISALLFMWAWNIIMPLMWTAAPVLTFWPSLGAVVLIGFVAGIFNRGAVVNALNKKD